jgi:hypothetical protein
LAENRVQLPAVVVDVTQDANVVPAGLQLGGGTLFRQDVVYHVIAETPWDRAKLHDVLVHQWPKRIVLFDKNRVADADAWPLTAAGAVASGAMMYPDMVRPTGAGGFGWRQLRLEAVRSAGTPAAATAPLYVASVRCTYEADLP